MDNAESLTPAHLLHGLRIISLPHEAVEERDLNDPTYGRCVTESTTASLSSQSVPSMLEIQVFNFSQGISQNYGKQLPAD